MGFGAERPNREHGLLGMTHQPPAFKNRNVQLLAVLVPNCCNSIRTMQRAVSFPSCVKMAHTCPNHVNKQLLLDIQRQPLCSASPLEVARNNAYMGIAGMARVISPGLEASQRCNHLSGTACDRGVCMQWPACQAVVPGQGANGVRKPSKRFRGCDSVAQ